MPNPKKNYIYNILYQLLIIIIPLITAPYLSRVIGVEGVGTYSYTYSIVYYFMLLTLLGINNYGNRSIAKVRDNKEKLSETFWSIYLFQLIMGIVMLILYIGYILFFKNEFKTYALIEILFVVSAMLDINWFFFGMEEFKITITRNTFVKLISVIFIFIFVNSQLDLWKYIFIMSGMSLFSQILLWPFLRKKIFFTKIKMSSIKKHVRPNLTLFIPVIAVSLYKIMDKIMLGYLASVTEVGYYDNAEKIVNVPLSLITALGTVMLPRISNVLAKGEIKKAEEYISKSVKFVMFMSIPMCCGLIGIGRDFAPLFFGIQFQKTGILIILLATTLPFLAFANVIRTQYLIPKEKDKTYIISVSLGAIVNLIINYLLIPKYGSIGACIGTIVAEISVAIYQSISVKNSINIKDYIIASTPFLLKSIIMLCCILLFNYFNINGMIKLLLQIIFGIIIYSFLNIEYIKQNTNLNMLRKLK